MSISTVDIDQWSKNRVREEEITKYMDGDRDFIPDADIERLLCPAPPPGPARVREILSKSLSIQTLDPSETAELLRVTDPGSLETMKAAALAVKKKVYDNRIVTFAPLYAGNLCVNNCLYCGFRSGNPAIHRSVLTREEIRREVEILAGRIGHKRLILVFGEHPETGIDYILDCIKTVYEVDAGPEPGSGRIRRVSINAAPMPIEELKCLHGADIATYQVFQETYHRGTYRKIHPKNTVKSHYRWRLFTMHRALEAGIEDVSIGALFGLYDWRFEILALVHHARELERRFGVGPHTVSFPRLEPAVNTPFAEKSPWRVSDSDFMRTLAITRLSMPTAGMVVTAREKAAVRREALNLGITQEDASSNIGVGAYQRSVTEQVGEKQQFFLGDTRSLKDLVRDLAGNGTITSFCTQGYRCGRTGNRIRTSLETGKEAEFCKLNAVLTFREWLDDFGDQDFKPRGEELIDKEIGEIRDKLPRLYPQFLKAYERVKSGERDIHF